MTTITELKKLLFSMILKTPIWLVHLAANQSSISHEHTYICHMRHNLFSVLGYRPA